MSPRRALSCSVAARRRRSRHAAACRDGGVLALREQRAREELVVFLFVEPGAFDVEEFETGHADDERERVDRQLRDRLVGARIGFVIENMHGVVADLQKVDMAGIERGAAPPAASSMPYLVSRLAISSSVSQIGISTAIVLESFASMKFCSVSCRSLLAPTAGMTSEAVSVAVFSLRLMTMRLGSAKAGRACEARAFGSSSRRKRSCGHVDGMFSRNVARASKR